MRKYNVVEVAFNLATRSTSSRIVARSLDANKAFEKARSLNDAAPGEGDIAKGYKVEAAT